MLSNVVDSREAKLEKVPGLDGTKITDIATGAEHSILVTGKITDIAHGLVYYQSSALTSFFLIFREWRNKDMGLG